MNDVDLTRGITFQDWLDNIKIDTNKELVQKHYSQTFYLKDLIQKELADINYEIYILAIIAEWCGDCHRNVPVLAHIAETIPKINLKLLIKEQNLDLLTTTNGGEKIPYVLFYGKDGYHITTWVERPTIAYKKLAELYRRVGFDDKPKISEGWREIFSEHQNEFYQATTKEIIEILSRINAIQGTGKRINTTT
ncbi:MAG: thioredoxin family protein [Candidatus Hodarchaeota archaeon]